MNYIQDPLFAELSAEVPVPLPRRSTAGYSERTPCKHCLMSRLFGREIGALSSGKLAVPGALWVDLTAGDGVAANGQDWNKNCSPGILAHHARFAGNHHPVRVVLYEKADRTYADLLRNLVAELPSLGYQREADNHWRTRNVSLTALNADSATFDPLTIPPDWAVQIVNDPNSVNGWAMDPGLMAAAKRRTWACLGMSTMGCNASGIKMLELDKRLVWYEHVNAQVSGLHNHHDLLLAAIERDAHQWAYLITAPRKWKAAVAEDARDAFGQGGFTLNRVWLRSDRLGFRTLLDELFLRRAER